MVGVSVIGSLFLLHTRSFPPIFIGDITTNNAKLFVVFNMKTTKFSFIVGDKIMALMNEIIAVSEAKLNSLRETEAKKARKWEDKVM